MLQHKLVLQYQPHKSIIYISHIYLLIKLLGIQHNFLSNSPTQFPIQFTLHPNNNKAVQYAYSAELQNVPTSPSCSTSSTPLRKGCALLQQIHMRSEHVLNPSFAEGVSSSPHKQADKINNTHVIFDEEQPLEPKASFTSVDPKLLCVEEDHFNKDLHGVTSMSNQGNKDYIEAWFQSVFGLQHHFILHQFLAPSFEGKLISHILEFIKLYFSIGSMSMLESLFRKWLHWKYAYT